MLDSKLGDEMQEVAIQERVFSSVGGRGGRVELCLSRSRIECLELASGGYSTVVELSLFTVLQGVAASRGLWWRANDERDARDTFEIL